MTLLIQSQRTPTLILRIPLPRTPFSSAHSALIRKRKEKTQLSRLRDLQNTLQHLRRRMRRSFKVWRPLQKYEAEVEDKKYDRPLIRDMEKDMKQNGCTSLRCQAIRRLQRKDDKDYERIILKMKMIIIMMILVVMVMVTIMQIMIIKTIIIWWWGWQ